MGEPCDIPFEDLLRQEQTNTERGFSRSQAADKMARDGPSEPEKPPKPTLLMLFIMQLRGFVIILLMIAAVASIVANSRDDPTRFITPLARRSS